jgi:hypothetical protein
MVINAPTDCNSISEKKRISDKKDLAQALRLTVRDLFLLGACYP